MPRRYIDYRMRSPVERGLAYGSYIGFGVLVFLVGVFRRSQEAGSGERIAGRGATTLEWQLPSPPPFHQWEQCQIKRGPQHQRRRTGRRS
jgi:cytochrome c oxidase subunit 1